MRWIVTIATVLLLIGGVSFYASSQPTLQRGPGFGVMGGGGATIFQGDSEVSVTDTGTDGKITLQADSENLTLVETSGKMTLGSDSGVIRLYVTPTLDIDNKIEAERPVSVSTTSPVNIANFMRGYYHIADHGTPGTDTEYDLLATAGGNIGLYACFIDNEGGAGKIILDPDASDAIIMDGVQGDNGEAIESDGTDGDSVCIVSISSSQWIVVDKLGTWAQETP
jgi:hypothetical protein